MEESGKYLLSLSVRGKVLGREECEMGRNLIDVEIYSNQLDWPRGALHRVANICCD